MRATGTLVPDGPNNGCLVLLVECVPRINKEKPTSGLLGVLCPEEAHHVHPSLNTRFHPSHQLIGSTPGL